MADENPSQHLRCLWNSGGFDKVAEKSFYFLYEIILEL